MASESVNLVLQALSSLYGASSRDATREASRWLEAFQKKHEAWTVSDYLLRAPESNTETRLFAAQTLKQKITYDLRELDVEARLQLRDALVETLQKSATESSAVRVQLCLALVDLAVQLLQWKTVVNDFVDTFGKTPMLLLELLKILPEEMNGNTRLPLSDEEYKTRVEELIGKNAQEVMNLLLMYMQSSENNVDMQEKIFGCLCSWIRTGDLDIRGLGATPLMGLSFQALDSSELFDTAVDVVSEIIYETRDVIECRSIIEQIYPYFNNLLSKLPEFMDEEDDDTVRGYCRIFVEAGESYINLIGAHPESFSSLVEGILKCSAYKNLDIVPMTFKFWYELTNLLETDTYRASAPQFSKYYDVLVDVMIEHLRYPDDLDSMTAEERDDFRDFRHKMGDTLKDCCRVLTPQRCLVKPMNLLTSLLNNSASSWQQIEAPIFSLRVMGSEVPKDEQEVMPHIMEFLSQLPDHPKIRYAATLVISRYSFWTELHPQYITYQLNFISAGFQNEEVAAASALALKHLCKDCREHMVDFVPQLHSFYLNVVRTLPFRDILEVTEAVSHVIAVIPPNEILEALRMFCLPVVQQLHEIVSKGKNAVSEPECVKMGDLLEQISAFFDIIRPQVPLGQPHPCVTFVSELWPMFDAALVNFGELPTVSEPLCKCFNSFILSYEAHFKPLLPQLMERLVNAFSNTGLSAYLWVSMKLIGKFAVDDGAQPCLDFVKRQSETMFAVLQRHQINDIPDVVEEYFRMVTAFLDNAPALLIQDPLFTTIFQAGIAALSITEPHALLATISFYRKLLEVSNKIPVVKAVFEQYGASFTAVLFDGLVDYYYQDSISDVAALFKSLAELLPKESAEWMMNVVNNVPEDYMTMESKSDFLTNYSNAINGQHWIKVRRTLSDFVAVYRRRNASKVRT